MEGLSGVNDLTLLGSDVSSRDCSAQFRKYHHRSKRRQTLTKQHGVTSKKACNLDHSTVHQQTAQNISFSHKFNKYSSGQSVMWLSDTK